MSDAPEVWQGTDPLTDKKWNLGEWYTEDRGCRPGQIHVRRAGKDQVDCESCHGGGEILAVKDNKENEI